MLIIAKKNPYHILFCFSVQPAKLPKSGQTFRVGTNATVSGWGTLSAGGSSPDTLMAVTVPLVSDECKYTFF
jgi:hypothetical protein